MKNIAHKIGSDVPIILERKNTLLTGKKNQILRINNQFNLDLVIVYPNICCHTKKIYKKNSKLTYNNKIQLKNLKKGKNHLIGFLKNEKNDLENVVSKIHPEVKNLIDFIKIQKGCCFSRVTGSGSACIGIFSNKRNAICAQKLIKLKFPKYWSRVSKTI